MRRQTQILMRESVCIYSQMSETLNLCAKLRVRVCFSSNNGILVQLIRGHLKDMLDFLPVYIITVQRGKTSPASVKC